MAEFPKFDETFKQNVNEKFQNARKKVAGAILKEDGSLDTERISSAVSGAARKVEEEVKSGYEKFSNEYVKDGSLDKEKLAEAAQRTYRKAGRSLATGVSKLADFLTDKFGTQASNGEIVDTHIVTADAEDFEPEA